jgi:protein transport protein SEC9
VKLKDTERFLDTANIHSNRALNDTRQLKQLNRSIFLPVIHRNKKHEVPEVPDQEETNHYRRKDIGDNLINGDSLVGGRMKRGQLSREQYKRYQFEATASDDEMEEEISKDLDEISETTKRLHELGRAMGEELDHQNGWIEGITEKTDRLDGKIRVNIDKVRRYSKLISIFI